MTKRRIVHIAFALIAALLSFIVWRTIRNDFSVLDGSDMLLIGVATVAALALFVLAALLFSRREFFLVAAAFLLPFLLVVGWGWQYLVVALLASLLLYAGVSWMGYAVQSRLTVGFYPFVTFGAPTMLTALAVLFACTGYFYPFQTNSITVPPEAFAYAAPLAESFIASRVPYYQKGMTFDEFIEAQFADSLKQAGISTIPSEARALIRSKVAEQKAGFERQLGIELSGSERFPEMLASAANGYLNRYLVSYKDFLPLTVAVFVFLTVKSLGFIINRFAVGLAWLLYRGLRAAGVVSMQKVATEREVLGFKSAELAPIAHG